MNSVYKRVVVASHTAMAPMPYPLLDAFNSRIHFSAFQGFEPWMWYVLDIGAVSSWNGAFNPPAPVILEQLGCRR